MKRYVMNQVGLFDLSAGSFGTPSLLALIANTEPEPAQIDHAVIALNTNGELDVMARTLIGFSLDLPIYGSPEQIRLEWTKVYTLLQTRRTQLQNEWESQLL